MTGTILSLTAKLIPLPLAKTDPLDVWPALAVIKVEVELEETKPTAIVFTDCVVIEPEAVVDNPLEAEITSGC